MAQPGHVLLPGSEYSISVRLTALAFKTGYLSNVTYPFRIFGVQSACFQ
jgi:hypothetical protein